MKLLYITLTTVQLEYFAYSSACIQSQFPFTTILYVIIKLHTSMLCVITQAVLRLKLNRVLETYFNNCLFGTYLNTVKQ